MKPFTTPVPNVITRRWHLVDCEGQTLGRLATKIAHLLMGKGDVDFSYHQDRGDYVVVTNAALIQVTGDKPKTKIYHHYSGFPGGLKSQSFGELMAKDPSVVITHAVMGMIPKNKLRSRRITRLKIFSGSEHPYSDKLNG
ncbi:MAG: 50S ribosomal protein L13 [Candidatus Shapirobacteria bacterium]